VRKALSIVKATALEIISEPLTLLILLASLVLSVLAPAFHYHQFGESTRMARDAGVSSLFLGGAALAVFGTIRAFRREIDSGTLDMALAHSISRGAFFLSKSVGCLAAYLAFALVLAAVAVTMVNGAAIGGAIADRTGDIARLWGPSLAIGVSVILLPLIIGAALNRFLRCRFVVSAVLLSAVIALAGIGYCFNFQLIARLLPVLVLVAVPSLVLMAAAATFAVRFKANAAASAAGLVLVAMVPFVGNYYLPDALAKGGFLPWSYVLLAVAAASPAIAAFLTLGVFWMDREVR